jgi:hypothetical protein
MRSMVEGARDSPLLRRCKRYSFVERVSSSPAPLPPRYARSPFPAIAGKEKEGAPRLVK